MSSDNPYTSPQMGGLNDEAEALTDDEEPWEEWVTTDTVVPRLFAHTIDNMLCFVVAVVVTKQLSSMSPVFQFFIFFGLIVGYFFVLEGLLSRTPGKFFLGLVVVDMQGRRTGWKASLIRTFWRLLEANPVLLGSVPAGLSVVTSKTHQRIGDRFARTLVVPARRL